MNELDRYTYEELVDRAWVLHDHATRMRDDPGYRWRYLTHEIGPDPLEDFDPDDPWFSEWQIEEYLAGRMAKTL